MLIKFLTELGSLPAITPKLDGVISIRINKDGNAGSVKGTKANAVCSNRGQCNTDSGLCACFAGYSSSDGKGGAGPRGDCGHASKPQRQTAEASPPRQSEKATGMCAGSSIK